MLAQIGNKVLRCGTGRPMGKTFFTRFVMYVIFKIVTIINHTFHSCLNISKLTIASGFVMSMKKIQLHKLSRRSRLLNIKVVTQRDLQVHHQHHNNKFLFLYELSGHAETPDLASVSTLEYYGIIPEDYNGAEPSSGNTDLQQSSTSVIQTDSMAPIINPGPSRLSDTALGKCRVDDSITDGPRKKSCKHTCQKCGQQQCGGAANQKYCQNSCQDCGEKGCCGQNSQHPRKTCAVGWGLHHKELKL
jgi:hypothetical protein